MSNQDQAYKQGQSHAQQNKGPLPDNSFKTYQEREKYNAGYNHGKKK